MSRGVIRLQRGYQKPPYGWVPVVHRKDKHRVRRYERVCLCELSGHLSPLNRQLPPPSWAGCGVPQKGVCGGGRSRARLPKTTRRTELRTSSLCPSSYNTPNNAPLPATLGTELISRA